MSYYPHKGDHDTAIWIRNLATSGKVQLTREESDAVSFVASAYVLDGSVSEQRMEIFRAALQKANEAVEGEE